MVEFSENSAILILSTKTKVNSQTKES